MCTGISLLNLFKKKTSKDRILIGLESNILDSREDYK